MATVKKSIEEKLKELELKKEAAEQRAKQIDAQMKDLNKKKTEAARKERTRRLIQNGALAEKYFDCDGADQGVFEDLLKRIVAVDGVREIIGADQ
ncbi:MAG: DUF3847 domain-containing protein [Oscillospiraceae bacterium]|nr:DUF3847 domain-containing protein [Oscillospiraceae bacterium]